MNLHYDDDIEKLLVGQTIRGVTTERNTDGIFQLVLALSSGSDVTVTMSHAIDPVLELNLTDSGD